MRRKSWFFFVSMVALPLVLLSVIAEQVSWRPRTFVVGGPINRIVFAPDGKTLAVGRYRYVTLKKTAQEESWSNCGQLELWDVSVRQPYLVLAQQENDPVARIIFSSTSQTITYINQDGKARQLDVLSHHKNLIPHLEVESFGGFTLSPDQKQIVVSHRDQIRFYDARSGTLRKAFTPRHRYDENGMGSIQFSPDGNILCAQITYDSSFNLFDSHSLKPMGNISIPNNTDTLEAGIFAPDSRLFAFAGSGWIYLYDVRSRQIRRKMWVGKESTRAIAWSPDQRLLAVGNYEGKLTLWNPTNGKLLHLWQSKRGYGIVSLSFSPDSRTLASAVSYPNQITLRRVQ